MGICWYCTWGWPEQVANIYKKYLDLLDGDDSALEFGPGHIVWSDENFETEHIKWCIERKPDEYNRLSPKTYDLVIESLKELLLVPKEIRCCCPEDYDDEHPENYPPPSNLKMIKKY